MSLAMADALMGIFGLRRVIVLRKCNRSKKCGSDDLPRGERCPHATPHDAVFDDCDKWSECAALDSGKCRCVPVKAKRKGKK